VCFARRYSPVVRIIGELDRCCIVHPIDDDVMQHLFPFQVHNFICHWLSAFRRSHQVGSNVVQQALLSLDSGGQSVEIYPECVL